MGLDFVNLALRVEEEFNIYIPNEAFEEIRTPADIAWFIHDEYVTKNYAQCSSQVGFYKIRKMLIDEFALKREAIKPSTYLAELFKNDIRKNWKKLNRLLDNKLVSYPLKLTKRASKIILFIALLIGLALFYQHFYVDKTPFLQSFLGSAVFTLFIWVVLSGMGQYFFGKVIPSQLTQTFNLIRFTEENHKINRYNNYKNILDKVMEISIDELGLDPLEIHEDSDYVYDLGVG